jgi:hypothetical protein
MKHTWESHPDYINLKKATEKGESIAQVFLEFSFKKKIFFST